MHQGCHKQEKEHGSGMENSHMIIIKIHCQFNMVDDGDFKSNKLVKPYKRCQSQGHMKNGLPL